MYRYRCDALVQFVLARLVPRADEHEPKTRNVGRNRFDGVQKPKDALGCIEPPDEDHGGGRLPSAKDWAEDMSVDAGVYDLGRLPVEAVTASRELEGRAARRDHTVR